MGVNSGIVLATGPGAGTLVAGLPLAVRAVVALREARFDDVALLAWGQPRWAVEPLVRRGVSVRWVKALAVAGHLEWFLYAAAGDAWLFTAALVAYGWLALPRRRWEATSR